MIHCSRCGYELPESGLTSIQPIECPSCGHLIQRPRNRRKNGLSLVRDYFADIWQILTRPTLFFRRMPIRGGMSRPLCFALVTHWVGAAFAFLWQLLFGGVVSHFYENLFRFSHDASEVDFAGRSSQFYEMRDRILQWFMGAGPVIADPFLTLFSILFTSGFVFIGARILVAPGRDGHPSEITYESAVRIVCFSMTPAILSAFPLVGGAFASLYILAVTVIAAKEVYRIHLGRAIVIALFPKLLFLGILFTGLFFIAVVVIKLMTSLF